MNYMDYCFLVVLILCGLAGMYQGLINTLIGFASVICSFVISIMGYHTVADAIKKYTPIYDFLKQATQNKMNNSLTSMPEISKAAELNDSIINFIMSKVYIPPVLRDFIINQTSIDVKNFDTSQIVNALSQNVADVFVNIMGFILIFATVQTIFTIVHILLHQFFMLPILHELNLIGGLVLGVLQGAVVLFVICAAWSMLSGWDLSKSLFVDLNESKYAKWFYNHNLLLDILVKFKII